MFVFMLKIKHRLMCFYYNFVYIMYMMKTKKRKYSKQLQGGQMTLRVYRKSREQIINNFNTSEILYIEKKKKQIIYA